jgi:hypothetical protein
MKLQALQQIQIMKSNMVEKLALAFLVSILARTRQVKMLQQIMFKEYIHCPNLLIIW